MKILLAAGIYPPQIGGPAQYAHALNQEFIKLGIHTQVVKYGPLLKLPLFLRSPFYFLKIFVAAWRFDVILGFDSLSVGLPAVLVGKILRKKVVLRLGGDLLWEQYVERTREKITLSQFYLKQPSLSKKEKLIFTLTRFVLNGCDQVIFSTSWLKDIFEHVYTIDSRKVFIVENALDVVVTRGGYEKKNFIWAGRNIFIKNVDLLKNAFARAQEINPGIELELLENVPHKELLKKLQTCYAVIYPSLSEVSPNFVLEALSYGKPSIVTQDTGYKNFLREVALFVDPLNEEDLVQKIVSLSNTETYQQLEGQIKNFSYRHTYPEIAREYIGLFKKIQ
jgi:glycosyltransferase involved in cell wall biosynthesis